MCVVILFFSMGNALAPKAEAANPAIAIEAVSLVIFVLGLLGITFSTVAEQNRAAEQAYIDIPELQAWIQANTVNIDSVTAKFLMTRNILLDLVNNVLPKVRAYFITDTNTLPVIDYSHKTFYNIKLTENIALLTDEQRFLAAPYNYTSVPQIIKNGVTYNYGCIVNSTQYYLALGTEKIWDGNGPMMLNVMFDGTNWRNPKSSVVKIGFNLSTSGLYLIPYIAYMSIDANGTPYYLSRYYLDNTGVGSIAITAQDVQYNHLDVPYNKTISYDGNELDTALKSKANGMSETDSISVPLDDPNWDATHGRQAVENPDTAVPAVPSTNWAEIWDALGIKDLIKTLTQNKPITLEESDFKAPQLPTGIADKFPFCVPFDMIAIVKIFYAEPKAPIFNIPIQFKELNYTQTFTFDFSGNGWEKIALAIRWGMTILYLYGLTVLTRRLIKG